MCGHDPPRSFIYSRECSLFAIFDAPRIYAEHDVNTGPAQMLIAIGRWLFEFDESVCERMRSEGDR